MAPRRHAGRELQRLVMQDIGRQREGLGDEAHVLRGPRRIGLLAPVQERSLAAVQAHVLDEGVFAVLRQRVAQGAPGLIGEGLVVEQVARTEEPDHAVGADRPAAAGAGVLRHIQSLRHAFRTHVRQLEAQRTARALRIQSRQRQVGREAQVAGPHVWPLRAGLIAVAGQRLAMIEGAVADRGHLVLAHLLLGQCEQAIEQRVRGIGRQCLLLDRNRMRLTLGWHDVQPVAAAVGLHRRGAALPRQ